MHPRVTGVEVVPPYQLRLTFADGSTGTVDGARWVLAKKAGVFAGTIVWPDDVDVDPDTLYEEAHRAADS